MIILGADLDLSGSVVALDDEGHYLDHIRFPTRDHNDKNGHMKRCIDCPTLIERIAGLIEANSICRPIAAYLEWPGVIMSNGMLQSASQHRTVGNVEAAFAGQGIICHYVPVREWKRHFNLIGKPKTEAKAIAERLCKAKFKATTTAEAALVARYGMRQRAQEA